MTIEEAIKHCKEKAENYRDLIIVEFEDGREFYDPEYEERAKYYEQLASWLEELVGLRNFVRFVTSEVVDDTFEESADCFAELMCRRLVKLGYVEIKGDTYLDIVNVKKVDENNRRKRGGKE